MAADTDPAHWLEVSLLMSRNGWIGVAAAANGANAGLLLAAAVPAAADEVGADCEARPALMPPTRRQRTVAASARIKTQRMGLSFAERHC
jgi:hypothetical protein